MKLHQLRAIVAICESGSIQEASRLLHISQPALSKGIKELEAELGRPVLDSVAVALWGAVRAAGGDPAPMAARWGSVFSL